MNTNLINSENKTITNDIGFTVHNNFLEAQVMNNTIITIVISFVTGIQLQFDKLKNVIHQGSLLKKCQLAHVFLKLMLKVLIT